MSEILAKSKVLPPPLSKGVQPSKTANDTTQIKKAPLPLLQKKSALKEGDSQTTKTVLVPKAKVVVSTKTVVGKMVVTEKKALNIKEQAQIGPSISKPSILKKSQDTSANSTSSLKTPIKMESKLEPKAKSSDVKAQVKQESSIKLPAKAQVNPTLPSSDVNQRPLEAKLSNKTSETSQQGAKLLTPDKTQVPTQNSGLDSTNNHCSSTKNATGKDVLYSEPLIKSKELPSCKSIQENPSNICNSSMANMQFLDPAMWQMVTTIAAICSAACQNNHENTGRHCCKRRHSRKNKKGNDSTEKNVSVGTKECLETNESQHNAKPETKNTRERNTERKDKIDSQYENIVSGTKWHEIEKKLANIRGLRNLDEMANGYYDDELAETNKCLSKEANQPIYYEEDEFPSEIPTRGKNRRYLAKEGVFKNSRFSKSPFVGGLSAARRRPYSSLTEMAAYFSNIEPQDQNDVIVMLLACRKLEKQIEEQQVIMQLLEHDLKEAQSLLRFPPEWRSLNSLDVVGHSPSPVGQIPPTNDPSYISNHPGVEAPWITKRPKEGLPSRSQTKL